MARGKNILYAQSGGPTAVINATALGVIETARHYPSSIRKVFAAQNGIAGLLREELIDTYKILKRERTALFNTPAAAFGSCRYRLKDFEKNHAEYKRLIQVFKAHDIGTFFYNGGGDSQDTAYKISQVSQQLGYPLVCIGIPKTIDNDLPLTDNCPGFGSVAKYVAVSIREASLDMASMAESSTKVFILEVMGRHAGWIAAASGLVQKHPSEGPHLILFPEVTFQHKRFLQQVKHCVNQFGFAVIVASEGIRNTQGKFLSESGLFDAFGHEQLGGVAPVLAQRVRAELGYKCHWAVSDYLQRAARHIASQVDVDQAYALGQAAVEYALKGKNAVMVTIERKRTARYQWQIGTVPLEKIANKEKKLPRKFISRDEFHITAACRKYLEPLIQGEAYPPYKKGLPQYLQFKPVLVRKRCGRWKA